MTAQFLELELGRGPCCCAVRVLVWVPLLTILFEYSLNGVYVCVWDRIISEAASICKIFLPIHSFRQHFFVI
jgi:hypothetical protein